MKKIFSLLIMTLCLFLAGCSDNENNSNIPELGIESSEVIFGAGGGEGSITVVVPNVTAKADKDWFTVSVSGNVIKVVASENRDVNGRTGQVILTSGNLKRTVPVTQYGLSIKTNPSEIILAGAGDEQQVEIICDIPVKVEASDSWINATQVGDTLIVKAGANEAIKTRKGTVKLSVTENVYAVISVFQDPAKPLSYDDLLGEWDFNYGEGSTVKVTLTTKTRNESFNVTGLSMPFVMKYYTNGSMEILKQDVGKSGTNTVRLCPWEVSGDGTFTWADGVGLISEPDGTRNDLIYTFVDNGVYGEKEMKGFILWMLNSSGGSAGEYKEGGTSRYTNVSMEKHK